MKKKIKTKTFSKKYKSLHFQGLFNTSGFYYFQAWIFRSINKKTKKKSSEKEVEKKLFKKNTEKVI